MQKIHDKYYIKTANEIRIQYYISQPSSLTSLSYHIYWFFFWIFPSNISLNYWVFVPVEISLK